jgi:adenosylhomocysteinase
MYLLQDCQLRVCSEYLDKQPYKDSIGNSRIIMLQHILPDTEILINLLKTSGADIFCILGKPFSYDESILERLKTQFRVEIHPYDIYDTTSFLDELIEEAYIASQKDQKPIIIFEVGGYFSLPLTRVSHKYKDYIKGVVEVTTFGHNKYSTNASDIEIPIYSVARSPIKSIEARYVGRAAVIAIDNIFREIGVSIAGRKALVIGFGMIGKSVADMLHSNNLLVSVYDKKGFARLNAYTLGYEINSNKTKLLEQADIIFSATAENSLSFEDIENCKNNAILVSVGSRGNEFDVLGLKNNSSHVKIIHPFIKRYKLNTNKYIYLVREGTAINFVIKSCPDEIVDLIYAEALVAMEILLDVKRHRTKTGVINEVPESSLHAISKDWLKHVL